MTENLTSISVVIPTYNGLDLLKVHLPSVIDQLRPGDELVIVDDHSTDESVKWLTSKFDLMLKGYYVWADVWRGVLVKQKATVVVCANRRNLRFGAASNVGVGVAANPWVLLLNSDVEPLPGCLDSLRAQAREGVFGVGCLEREPKGKDSFQLGGKNKLWFERGRFWHSRADDFESGETAWVSGGSGLFNRHKWQQLEGFDRRYFPAYWEDVDLSARARQRGWQIRFSAEAVVLHNHETTNSDVFGQKKIAEMSWRHGSIFAWRHANAQQRVMYLLWWPYWWVKRWRAKP
jgi:GT2 family glycosyltransferase